MDSEAVKALIDLYVKERDYYKERAKTLLTDNYQLEKELLRKNEIIQSYEDPPGETSRRTGTVD